MRRILYPLVWTGLLSLSFYYTHAQVNVTKTDSLIHDANNNMLANPGDSLRYKTNVKNPGAGDVIGAEMDINASGNLNMNPASFRTTPVAVNDTFDVTANIGITVDSTNGLKPNDFDDNYAGATLLPEVKMTTMNGDVTINADGSFDYSPDAGFVGTDAFTYTLLDGNTVPGCPPQNDAIVTLNVGPAMAPLVWFINNTDGGVGGEGTLDNPFKTLNDFNISPDPQPGDIVFLENTGTNYDGGIILQNNQTLWGTGHTAGANLADILPYALAPNSFTLPAINGTRPTIVNSTVGGDGIRLASGNSIRGLNVGNSADFAIDDNGNVGTLTISEVDINTTGAGFRTDAGGTLAVTLGSLTSTGGLNAVHLGTTSGAFAINGATIASGNTSNAIQLSTVDGMVTFGVTTVTATGANQAIEIGNNTATISFASGSSVSGSSDVEIEINQGSGNVTYAGTVTNTSGGMIRVNNRTGGAVDFQGNLSHIAAADAIIMMNNSGGTVIYSGASKSITSDTGTGIALSNNGGTTINFTNGGLVINTTSGIGFSATGGGTINVTGAGNTINATTGPANTNTNTALNITNTTIGASNLNFLSISSGNNTAAADPANGIVLNNTGMSGGLIITGTGSTNGSGGTIQHITNRGMSATSTINLSLKNMTFFRANLADAAPCGAADNSGCNAAIHLNTVTNAILDNVDIDSTQQQGINLREVDGFQLLNSTVIRTGGGGDTEEAGLYALNLFGTSAITNSSVTFPKERASVIYNTSKTLNLTVTNSTFGMNQTMPIGADAFEISSFGASNTTLDIVNSTFIQPKTNGLQVITEGTSFTSVDVTGSTFDPGTGLAAAIDLVTNGSGDMNFNIVDNPMIAGRGINIVNIFAFPNSTFEGRINNNTIVHNGGSGAGVRVVTQGNGNSQVEIKDNDITAADDYGITTNAVLGTGRLDVIITGNTVSISTMGFYTIHAAAGASGSLFTNKVCAHVASNTTTAPVGSIGNFQARAATAPHEILLQGVGVSVSAVWNSNLNTPMSPPAIISQSGTGTFTFGATCVAPTHPNP